MPTNVSQFNTSQRLALLVSKFPCFDEMFILREMAALAEAGFDYDLNAVKASHEQVVQAQAQKLLPRVHYLPFFFSAQIWQAQFYFLMRKPLRYVSTLLLLVFEMWRKPVSLLKSLMLFPKALGYAHLLQQRGVVHLHAFWATFPATMAWMIQRFIGLSYSISAHAHDIYEDDSMLARKIRCAMFVMTCTDYNREHLSALVPEKREAIKLIYHGLDLKKFYEDAAARVAPQDKLRILSIGTFYKTKGFDTLIAACALLKKQSFAFECKIVGDGPEREHLQAMMAQHDLQNEVQLLGYLKQEELRPLRLWASVFILLPRPYLHWGIPNVFIESLAARLPVIATPLNAINELIRPEHTGTIVPCDDPAAATAALREVFENPQRHATMALAGQKLVAEKFDAQRTTPQVLNMFRETLAQKS